MPGRHSVVKGVDVQDTSRPSRAPVAVLNPDAARRSGGSDNGAGDGDHSPGPPPPPAPPVVPEASGPRRRKPRRMAAFLLLTIASALVLVPIAVGGDPSYTASQAPRHQRR